MVTHSAALLLALLVATRVSALSPDPPPPAATVATIWDDANPPAMLSGFGVFRWDPPTPAAAGKWTQVATVKTLTWDAPATPGSTSYYITAISLEGVHSAPSNVLTIFVPTPPTVRRKVVAQRSRDLKTWEDLATVFVDEEPGQNADFFRLTLTDVVDAPVTTGLSTPENGAAAVAAPPTRRGQLPAVK